MSEAQPERPETFDDFVAQRHAEDRTVAVYVEGDLDNDPPLGNAAATRVASRLAGDKEVLRVKPEMAAGDGGGEDVGCILVELPEDPADEEWRALMRRALSRVPRHIDLVTLVDSDAVPYFCRDLYDIRVVATEIDATVEFYRPMYNPYSGEVHYRQMESGLA